MSDKVIDSTFAEPVSSLEAWADFVIIVRQLRRQCPWDREQTHESLRHLLIEEAYETVEAIDNEDAGELKEELGDLVLQAALHSVIAEENTQFNLRDVLAAVNEKLIRRHPHVFGGVDVAGVDDVLATWESIKAKERKEGSMLEGVPLGMPALLGAYRMQEKVAGVGFDFPDVESTWAKVEEEIREFREASNPVDREAEFGDLLFALVNFARRTGINPEMALRESNRRFRKRLEYVERNVDGGDLKSASLEEMDRHWEASKVLG